VSNTSSFLMSKIFTMKPNQKILWVSVVCLVIITFLSACGAITEQDVTLNLKESSVNEIIQSSANSPDVPFRVSGIDMKDGFIRVFLSYLKADGSQLTGSYDLTLKVSDGQPTASISNVNMPGLKLDRDFLDKISKLIADDFILAATKINGQVNIQSLNISEDRVQLIVTIK